MITYPEPKVPQFSSGRREEEEEEEGEKRFGHKSVDYGQNELWRRRRRNFFSERTSALAVCELQCFRAPRII